MIVAAIGLTVLYGIRGFANFAYGDLMTLGAYLALLLSLNGLSLIWGAIVSFLVLAVVGVLLEVVIFARLEGRGPVPPIVASVGVGLIIQNGVRAVAGTQEWLYPVPAVLTMLGWAWLFWQTGTTRKWGLAEIALGALAFLIRAREVRQWPFESRQLS